MFFFHFLFALFLYSHKVLFFGLEFFKHKVLNLLLLLLISLPYSFSLLLFEFLHSFLLLGLNSLFFFNLFFSLICLFLLLNVLLFFTFLKECVWLDDLLHFLWVLFRLYSNLFGMAVFLLLKLNATFLDFLLTGFEFFSEFVKGFLIFLSGVF